MSLVSKWAFFCVLLVVLAGCETIQAPPTPLTTIAVSRDMEIATPAPLIAPPPEATTPAPIPTVVSSWPTNWVTGWIPLESWSKYNGLDGFTLVKSNPHTTLELPTANGPVAVKLGTRLASLNGLECWFGFAPQSIQGTPCVHWLDAKKNLQPLVRPINLTPGGTIVLDPGHGGVDSGAKSAYDSHHEKEYTLDWALRLANLLEQKGWKVVLTRNRDAGLSLPERVEIADTARADLFISLHFNSGIPNRELAGVETYCLTPTGMPSSILLSHEDDLRQSYPNNAFDEPNFLLALRLHSSLVRRTAAIDRGVRRARFMGVLRPQNRPAVLLEGGYLSNYNEARQIAQPDYRQKLAEAVAAGLNGNE